MSRNISDLHPRLQEKITELKKKCSEQGITIGISECLRTVAEQDALYAKGRTAPGKIVTNAKGTTYSSQHMWGIAADFYLDMDVDGDGSKSDDAFNNNTKLFNKVGAIAKSIGLGWGGDWTSFKDLPHVYLPDWGSTVTKLKTMYGSPEKFFATWSNASTSTATSSLNQSSGKYTLKDFIYDVQVAEGQTGSALDAKAGNITLGLTPTISAKTNRNHKVVTPLERYLKELDYYTGKIEADEGLTPIFGKGMTAAVNSYQSNVLGYKNPDGEITAKAKMWKKLLGMI